MGSRTTIVVMFLFILPMLIVTDISPVQHVSAALTAIMETLLHQNGILPLNVWLKFQTSTLLNSNMRKSESEIEMMVRRLSQQISKTMMVLKKSG